MAGIPALLLLGVLPAAAGTARLAPRPLQAAPAAPAIRLEGLAAPAPLLATLAAPALDLGGLGALESAGAAARDFAARAQLGAASDAEGGVRAVPVSAVSPALRLLPAAKSAERPLQTRGAVAPIAAAEIDFDGSRMRGALARALEAKGEAVDLGFIPTRRSLQAMAEQHREYLLWRRRDDGRWRLAGGQKTMSVSETDEDYDWAIHNHPMIPGLAPYTAGIPTPEDFRIAEGRRARFAVITPHGVAEWNPHLPARFWERLTATAFGRAAVGVLQPYFYEGHVRRLGAAIRQTSWRRLPADWLDAGSPPMSRALLKELVIPAAVAAELSEIAPRLGRNLDATHEAQVKSRTRGYDLWWHSSWTYKDHPDGQGVPDGHFREDFGIRLMVKPGWARLTDPFTHYRVLFAHEYAHWLQSEGVLSYRYGGEIVAVAAELLRAVELLGVQGLSSGRAGTIHEGTIRAFENGRRWARGPMNDESALYWRGTLGGVAYEAAVAAEHPEAAWEFLRLVCAGRDALSPRQAWLRVVGREPGR